MDFEPSIEQAINFYQEGFSRKKIAFLVQRAIDTGKTYDVELPIINTAGEVKWTRSIGKVEFKNGECTKIYGTFQDITKEKLKSIELDRTKQQLESIFEEMSDVVWSMTVPDYQMTFLTPSIKKLSGYSAGFLMDQKNWWEKVVHPDDYEVIDIALDILDKKGEYSINHRIKTKSGEIKWVSNKGKYIYDENNEPVRFDALVRDRTPQIMAERELQKELALQEIIIKVSSTYINIDLQHIETAIQKSLEELGTFVHADRVYIFDYDLREETMTNTYEWCAEGITSEIDNLQNIPITLSKSLLNKHLNGEYYYSYDSSKVKEPEFKKMLEDQGIKSLITFPMMENENLTGFVGLDSVRKHHNYSEQERKLLFIFAQMIINVKNRQKWENQLILQEEKYRNIISNLNLGLLNLDKNQNITFVNSIFCEMSGHQAEDLLGRNIAELPIFKQSYKTVKEKEDLRKKGIPDTYDLKVNLVDGKEHWWLVSGAPNYNDKGEIVGTIGAMLDITDQKQMEQQLVYSKSQAEQAGKAKEIFLAKMSHEIRTPLSVVIGMIRQLSRSNLRGKNGFYVHQADSAARHLLTILNNILDMAKIDAGELTLENKTFSIKHVALNLKNIFFQRATEQNIAFKIYLSSNIKPALVGDEVRLKQILFNLLSNSLKFTREGFISLVMEAVKTTQTHQTVKIMAVDSGIGMTKEFVSQVFEKFSQEHDEFNRKFDGTGLGMAIARDLVEQMGGELIVESLKNVGTTVRFEISLPIADPQQLKRIDQTELHKESMAKINILVVEDNDMNRFLVRESLKVIGCQVVEAKNGKEAVELLNNRSFDLVFMDIQMPEMNGIQATKIIRQELESDVPIIALTANAFKQDIDKYLKIGMDDFITKPYEEQDLYRKLSQYLDLSKKGGSKQPTPKEIKKLYDLSSLEAMDAGNGDFLPKILNVFVDMSRKSIDQLKSAYEERDLNTLRKVAHKLKPSIDQLKIELLKTKIREIEKYPEVELPDPHLENLLEDVIEVLTTAIREIESKYLIKTKTHHTNDRDHQNP